MSKASKYRTGIDERPLTKSEFERLKNGESIYKHIVAPKRPIDKEQVNNIPTINDNPTTKEFDIMFHDLMSRDNDMVSRKS